MKIEKNIDKCGTKGLSGFSERGGPDIQREDFLISGNKKSLSMKKEISCSNTFLPYVSDKTKKNGGLFVCYFFFCLSLRQI